MPLVGSGSHYGGTHSVSPGCAKSNAPDPLKEQERRDSQAVRDAAGARPCEDVGDGRRRHLDLLVMVPAHGTRENRPLDQNKVAAVVHDRRVRMHASEEPRGAASVSGFLRQLPDARGDGILAGLDHAPGNLERELVRPEPELTHEDEPSLGGERRDVHPARRVRDHVVALCAADRMAELDAPKLQDPRRREHPLGPARPPRRLAGGHFFSGSLSFSPTLRWVQAAPGLTDSRSDRVQPLARAIFEPVSPGFTMYSPGPATAVSPLGPFTAAFATWASSMCLILSLSVPKSLAIVVTALCVELDRDWMSLAALSLAACAELTCDAMSSILATLSCCPATVTFSFETVTAA